jgi:hypothetical protein
MTKSVYKDMAVRVVVAVYTPAVCTTPPPTPTLKCTVVVLPLGVFAEVLFAMVSATVSSPSQHARAVSFEPVLHVSVPLSLNRDAVSTPDGEYPK